MNPQLAWHVARAAGLVAWALSAVSVLGGFALSGRALAPRVAPRAWLADLHRAMGGLAVVFTGVHVAALVADNTVAFSAADVLVPFASEWRPGAVAWGVVAAYLLLAVEISSLLRRRLPLRWWRRLHLLSVPVFAAGTVHLAAAGTDADLAPVRVVVLVTAGVFVVLAVHRVLARPPRPGPPPRPPRASGPARGARAVPRHGHTATTTGAMTRAGSRFATRT